MAQQADDEQKKNVLNHSEDEDVDDEDDDSSSEDEVPSRLLENEAFKDWVLNLGIDGIDKDKIEGIVSKQAALDAIARHEPGDLKDYCKEKFGLTAMSGVELSAWLKQRFLCVGDGGSLHRVLLKITNYSGVSMSHKKDHFDHGKLDQSYKFPEKIANGQTEASVLMYGSSVGGWCEYELFQKGIIGIGYNNPFMGRNKMNVKSDNGAGVKPKDGKTRPGKKAYLKRDEVYSMTEKTLKIGNKTALIEYRGSHGETNRVTVIINKLQ